MDLSVYEIGYRTKAGNQNNRGDINENIIYK